VGRLMLEAVITIGLIIAGLVLGEKYLFRNKDK
jgi:hypothetical protein